MRIGSPRRKQYRKYVEKQQTESEIIGLGAADCKENCPRQVSQQQEVCEQHKKKDKSLGEKHCQDEAPSGVGQVKRGETKKDESRQGEFPGENSQTSNLCNIISSQFQSTIMRTCLLGTKQAQSARCPTKTHCEENLEGGKDGRNQIFCCKNLEKGW